LLAPPFGIVFSGLSEKCRESIGRIAPSLAGFGLHLPEEFVRFPG
jgi:hypothetical protein